MTEFSRKDHRLITKRILVRGTLVLDTPTCLGTGDADSLTDLPLLRDSLDDKYALLTGSSIAGALRNYLRERNKGYGKSERRYDSAALLFGDLFSYKDEQNITEEVERIKLREQDTQSPLIINDAISTKPIQSELRDGVKINSITRTVDPEARAKYDLELLQAGTEFRLCFELLIEKKEEDETKQKLYETGLRKGLAIALSGLEQGEISLGMKKRRGFGRCHIQEWQVWKFNLEDPGERMAWLKFEHWHTSLFSALPSYSSIQEAFTQGNLKVDFEKLKSEDERDRFTINATFTLASPLLIRSGQAETGRAPDVVHLKSERIVDEIKYCLVPYLRQWMFNKAIEWLNLLPQEISLWNPKNLEIFLLAYLILKPSKSKVPILSGTSLAGVLRHRAERIVKTLQCSFGQNPECDKEPEIIKSIFGQVENKRAQASRLIVREAEIKGYEELVQTRIAIDRFTGGAYHGALFDEQPIFGNDETCVTIELELRQPSNAEIGLLLLLLKDLWTSDLPVGAESSIGRGKLQGIHAEINRYTTDEQVSKKKTWTITQYGKLLQVNDAKILESFVTDFINEVRV